MDISPVAIDILTQEMPEHQFLCQDICHLAFPPESFDIVNSVTVLEHLPEEEQRTALCLIYNFLKSGGYLVLLENINDFEAMHVFPHRKEDWIKMVESAGLRLCSLWGSNFEVLFRAMLRVACWLRQSQRVGADRVAVPSAIRSPSLEKRIKSVVKTVVAWLSFPIEWVCDRLPVAEPSHSVMIFRKEIGVSPS